MSNQMDQATEAEKNLEIWKIKKLIKSLESARGNGTSMISLIIPPKSQISQVSKMLAEEFVSRESSALEPALTAW
jgi:peptide chain release factor subunit 1